MATAKASRYAADKNREESAAVRAKLNSDVKNNTPEHVYVLYGEEAFLRRSYRNILRKLITDGDDMNVAVFEGNGIDAAEVIDLSQTLPFFAERRLIVIENSGWFTGKDPGGILEALEKLPESTYIIFCEETVDRRLTFTKKVSGLACMAKLDRQSDDDLCRWAARKVKAAGKDLQVAAARLLVERIGNDMNALSNEIDKVLAYCGDRPAVTAADVEAVGTVRLTDRLFDMIDAAIEGRTHAALDIYADLLALKEAPLKIMIICGRHLSALLSVKELAAQGLPDREIAAQTGVRDFLVRKYRRQTGRLTETKLIRLLDSITELDASIKAGTVPDQLAVELFITELGR